MRDAAAFFLIFLTGTVICMIDMKSGDFNFYIGMFFITAMTFLYMYKVIGKYGRFSLN